MKALIRRDGETVRETDGIDGIDWTTGEPLTNKDWCGGPYELVENYVDPESAASGNPVSVPSASETKTYTIDGKSYTKEQILSMLN